MKKIFHTVTMAALLVAATSCEHKELCLDHAHAVEVEVVFDWRNAPNAAPASMSLYLFPGDGEALRYDFTGRDGGTIRVPIGKYEALCLNSDTENIVYRNTERKGTFEVTTQTSPLLGGLSALGVRSEGAPRADGAEDERVALSPDMLWSDHAESIELKHVPVRQRITLYPEQSVCRYTVEIRNVENLKYVFGVSGSISGLAGGLLPGTDMPNANKGAYLAVKVNITTKDGARVYPAESVGEYDWAAVAVGTNWQAGKKYIYTLDFSEGAGKVDSEKEQPEDPTVDPFDPGEDILGSPIKFTVEVSEWEDAGAQDITTM